MLPAIGMSHRDLRGKVKRRRGGGRVEYVYLCGRFQRDDERVVQNGLGEDKSDNLIAKGNEDIRWKAMRLRWASKTKPSRVGR